MVCGGCRCVCVTANACWASGDRPTGAWWVAGAWWAAGACWAAGVWLMVCVGCRCVYVATDACWASSDGSQVHAVKVPFAELFLNILVRDR